MRLQLLSPYAGITQIRFVGSVAVRPPSQPSALSSPFSELGESIAQGRCGCNFRHPYAGARFLFAGAAQGVRHHADAANFRASICANHCALLSFPLMQRNQISRATMRDRWLPGLHVTLISIFAFVLPFVCWGAEAMPGHAHARAHFVFLPPTAHEQASVRTPAMNANAVIQAAARAVPGVLHDLCAAPRPTAAEQDSPAGMSRPFVLAVTLLLLAAVGVQRLLAHRDGAGFLLHLTPLHPITPPLAAATPPPR